MNNQKNKGGFSPCSRGTSFLAVVSLCAAVTIASLSAHGQTTVTEKIKGISYASWYPGEYRSRDADLALGKLAATGARDVAIIVTQYQPTISSLTIAPTSSTPTDEDVTHAIRMAHGLGLRVMLKPHLDLSADPSHWRGDIGTGFDESQWNAWFASYENFIMHYVELAKEEHVERFCVGTELVGTRARASQWRSLIAKVRTGYSGDLLYAANFEPHPSDISWWDALDFIGIDAYYPLTEKDDPTTAELAAAWPPIIGRLTSLAATWHKPIVFTEIGYRSVNGANRHPWDWTAGGTWDLTEQADCYETAFRAVWNQPWFGGMYWWSWDTSALQGGPCATDYTPANKPAENILRQWYGAPPRVHSRPPEPDPSRSLVVYDDALPAGWENWSWNTTVNFAATDYVTSGTYSMSASFGPWGGLFLHCPAFAVDNYSYLEFYARKQAGSHGFRVSLRSPELDDLRKIPLEDCRYTAGTPIEDEQWTLVRIPLDHLEATGRTIEAVVIQNWSDSPAHLWIDSLRFVGAR